MKPFRYYVPTEIVLEPGCLNTLGNHVRRFGTKALLVTGKQSVRTTGALPRIMQQLPNAVLFEGVEENPVTETCEAGAELCKSEGCDVVVAVGGGSAMDAAKAIAVLATNPPPCARYFGGDQYAQPNLPIICVPTTAGTGSEVTPYSVLIDRKDNSKRTIAGHSLFPVVALLDAELSVTMPRYVTVNTGLDALSQAMEGMASKRATALGDMLALEACRIIRQWLPVAADHPANLEARSNMLYAAMLSGCVIAQSGTTLVHGMGYLYTTRYGIAHGLANALLLTPLFQYNARIMPDTVNQINAALGVPSPNPASAGPQIGKALHGLLGELGVSPAARDAGVEEEALAEMAHEFFADKPRFKNQPGDFSLTDIQSLFRQSYDGSLA